MCGTDDQRKRRLGGTQGRLSGGGKKSVCIESGRPCMGVIKIFMKAHSGGGLVKHSSRVSRNGRIKKWNIWQQVD